MTAITTDRPTIDFTHPGRALPIGHDADAHLLTLQPTNLVVLATDPDHGAAALRLLTLATLTRPHARTHLFLPGIDFLPGTDPHQTELPQALRHFDGLVEHADSVVSDMPGIERLLHHIATDTTDTEHYLVMDLSGADVSSPIDVSLERQLRVQLIALARRHQLHLIVDLDRAGLGALLLDSCDLLIIEDLSSPLIAADANAIDREVITRLMPHAPHTATHLPPGRSPQPVTLGTCPDQLTTLITTRHDA